MVYLLMHKDVKVMAFELTPSYGIGRIVAIFEPAHLPFSTKGDIMVNHASIARWWSDRSIPLTRDEYADAAKANGWDDPKTLAVRAHGLSLDDQYWIKGEGEEIAYEDVSFFSNKFSGELGDVLLGQSKGDIDYRSPDATSNGDLKKRWKDIGGIKYLLKAGSGPYQYQIFGEILASKIMGRLEVEHVDYSFVSDKGRPYCASSNFVSYNEDFVSAYQLYNSAKRKNDVSPYDHLLSVCEGLGIPGCKRGLEQMFVVDFLIGNVDRHLNNFGAIRDAKTLEFLRLAPVYDSGSSFGFDLPDERLALVDEVDWKPFQSRRVTTQLDLVEDISWLDLDALEELPKLANDTLLNYGEYVSDKRREAMVAFLVRRINALLRHYGIDKEVTFDATPLTLLERRILALAKYSGGEIDDLDALAKELSVAYITAYRALSELTKKGILKRVGSRKSGYWKVV